MAMALRKLLTLAIPLALLLGSCDKDNGLADMSGEAKMLVGSWEGNSISDLNFGGANYVARSIQTITFYENGECYALINVGNGEPSEYQSKWAYDVSLKSLTTDIWVDYSLSGMSDTSIRLSWHNVSITSGEWRGTLTPQHSVSEGYCGGLYDCEMTFSSKD